MVICSIDRFVHFYTLQMIPPDTHLTSDYPFFTIDHPLNPFYRQDPVPKWPRD